jgi:hypothetical protein
MTVISDPRLQELWVLDVADCTVASEQAFILALNARLVALDITLEQKAALEKRLEAAERMARYVAVIADWERKNGTAYALVPGEAEEIMALLQPVIFLFPPRELIASYRSTQQESRMDKLPPEPSLPGKYLSRTNWLEDQVNYWESRCRLAVEALEAYRNHSVKLPLISADQYITVAKNALDRIGPLPAQHTEALK